MKQLAIHAVLRAALLTYGLHASQIFPTPSLDDVRDVGSSCAVKAGQISKTPSRDEISDLKDLLRCKVGSVSAPQIFFVGNRLKVLRIDAGGIPAKVVHIRIIGDRSFESAEEHAGYNLQPSAVDYHRVANRVESALPYPTPGLFVYHIQRIGNLAGVMDNNPASAPAWAHSHTSNNYHGYRL